MKRGISPLVAVVLLVGLAVTLSIVLLNFFDVFSQDRIDDIDVDSLKGDLCSDKTWLDLEGYCVQISPSRSDLHISFENNGAYQIEEIFFRIASVDNPSVIVTHTQTTRMPGYGIGAFSINNAGAQAGDYDVIVEKKLDYNGTDIYCDPMQLNMELLTCRSPP